MKRSQHPTPDIQHPTPNQAESRVWEFNEGGKESRKYDLEERLLEFASAVIDLSEALPTARAGRISYASIQTAKRNDLAAKRKRLQSTHYPPGDAG